MASCKTFYKILGDLALFFIMSSFSSLGTSARLLGATGGGDLVSFTCNHTLYFDECVSSLRSDPRSQTSDLNGLAVIALDLSIAHGKETLSYIHKSKSQAANDSQYLSRCLDDCIEEYSDALQSLQDSTQALRNKSYSTVDTFVTAAMTDSDSCEDGFKEMPDSNSPLTKRNEFFNKLCSNFLAITILLN